MRTLYIAGFFAPTLEAIRVRAQSFCDEHSVVIVPQRQDRQVDLNDLKADMIEQLKSGCEAILICVFVFRNQEYVWQNLQAIVGNAQIRFANATIELKRFKNAQDINGLNCEILRFAPSKAPIFPESLDCFDVWFAGRYKDRIFFHPRALRGAKKSRFQNVSLIFVALTVLAEEYWRMRTAAPAAAHSLGGALVNRLNEIGLELSPSISLSSAGEQGDEYWVIYPVGSTKKMLLDLHLKLGDDRDERWCLRIYFFWDELTRRVVVGWLPSHLTTKSS